MIVDQEIAFQDPGDTRFEKIDLCIFDKLVSAFSFVEVKTLSDPRLVPSSEGEVPKVIEQLSKYKNWIEQNGKELIEAFADVVQIKRNLGMQDRLADIPEVAPKSILSRPALVIGNCTRAHVKEIMSGEGAWKPLTESLPSVASGLFLCGDGGANLELNSSGRQTIVFDSAVTH